MRIGDLDALYLQLWRKADPFKEQPSVKPSAVWSEAATLAREAPTIDPETLPIVRQLREELARVTEERDALLPRKGHLSAETGDGAITMAQEVAEAIFGFIRDKEAHP